ncbi:hypothetical protein LQV63_23825 [Paenibacillus profundus]|uniref:CopG family transcriptional regulator n=1 Tax=Paenibacillus profundus TaxID=1173085 RepID=A0ABS8YPR9_9BACL|nr:hypothetical protein [Paenibacillus profundus]MCE5172312.1 hypothetical protein [Paenibacillus profundus]
MSVPNDELEKLISHLNNKNKVVAKSFLSWLLENQSEDDDFLLTDDIVSINKGKQELLNGETTSLEDLKRELEL